MIVLNTELRTILANLELGRRYSDWDIVDRAITRLAVYVVEDQPCVRR